MNRNRLASAFALATVAAVATAGLTACGTAAASKTQLNLVNYSVPKPAYDALEKAFQATDKGKNVTFNASYGASGTQSKAVDSGQAPADFVNFSLSSDLTKLVPSKVAADWNTTPTKGIAADSVVVIVVRKGNPKNIKGWDDLIKPGVQIVTPDPASSGGAKWNVLAAYQQVIAKGGTDADATAYLTSFFKNVVSRAASGSAANQQFINGVGDAEISYEAEAIASRAKGDAVDYIVPDQTVLIETPAAVTLKAPTQAKDFLSYIESPAGQAIFAANGFRPALAGVKPATVKGAADPANPYPTPAKLITVSSLGGWSAINAKFFGDGGLVTKIEAAH